MSLYRIIDTLLIAVKGSLTHFLTHFFEKISKKDGKRRNYENAMRPYFMRVLARYET